MKGSLTPWIGARRSRRFNKHQPSAFGRRCGLKAALLFLACALNVFGAAETTRFLAMDIYIDPKGEPLAAYQLDITAPPGTRIVGVEGGEHPEFRKAPYYDPKGIQHERLIVAAFSAAPNASLPTRSTRVLTLHLESDSLQTPKLETTFKLTATSSGQKFPSEITLSERKQQ